MQEQGEEVLLVLGWVEVKPAVVAVELPPLTVKLPPRCSWWFIEMGFS
jgi:hypothetical protein